MLGKYYYYLKQIPSSDLISEMKFDNLMQLERYLNGGFDQK